MKYQGLEIEFDVIWDGSRTGPNGGYLGCAPEKSQAAPDVHAQHRNGHSRRLDSDIDATAARGHFKEPETPVPIRVRSVVPFRSRYFRKGLPDA